MSEAMVALEQVSKSYAQGKGEVRALEPFSCHINKGEIVALVGASGSGKSTLLHIAGLLLQPDQGEVWIDGTACHALSERDATLMRRQKLGFVYQFHHLLPELTARENSVVPLMLGGQRDDTHVDALLAAMGLAERGYHLPSELSGGEQQRVAIARALVHQPALLLADEPTGNLDPETSAQVESMMISLLKERGATALIVTHNHEMAKRMDRVITLS